MITLNTIKLTSSDVDYIYLSIINGPEIYYPYHEHWRYNHVFNYYNDFLCDVYNFFESNYGFGFDINKDLGVVFDNRDEERKILFQEQETNEVRMDGLNLTYHNTFFDAYDQLGYSDKYWTKYFNSAEYGWWDGFHELFTDESFYEILLPILIVRYRSTFRGKRLKKYLTDS